MICGFKMLYAQYMCLQIIEMSTHVKYSIFYQVKVKLSWLHQKQMAQTSTYKYCPLQHVGYNHRNEALQSQKESLAPVNVNITIIVWTLYLIFPDTCLPVAVVCQGQSFGVQSEVWPLLPSDSRICGLRHELDVCRRGQRNKVQQPFISIRWNKYQTKYQTSR